MDAREAALKADLLDLIREDRKAELVAVSNAGKSDSTAKPPSQPEPAAAKPSSTKPADLETPAAGNTKTSAKVKPGDKPADPPKDLSPAKAAPKAAAKAKELDDAGSEESSDKGEKPASPAAKPADERETLRVELNAPPRITISQPIETINFSPLAKDRPAAGPFVHDPNFFNWSRIEQLAFLLTWSLAAIGLCLMLGLFTRPAALGGACFMLFVVLSQPAYPGVYPVDPPQMGHALLVNKDFIEMIALLVIASSSLGRWTGMDFFIHNFLIKPFCGNCCRSNCEGGKA